VPAATEEEGQAIQRAAAELQESGFNGARQHLVSAAECLNANDFAGSVRESIHAVESVACRIDPEGPNTLGPALKALERHNAINKAMRAAFEKLYGYTSDEEGVRHALVFDSEADVDGTDATFMLGACASFVSYLLARGRETGLLNE